MAKFGRKMHQINGICTKNKTGANSKQKQE